jgi:hypothetical protein
MGIYQMSKADRLKVIKDIEGIRKSKVICYITGDKRGYETRIHPEVQMMLFDHLQKLSPITKLDLFLYSTGGVTMAAWGIVNMIREFCDDFNVIIPYKAYSTATLISLGANEILMGKLGQLGPVDPSVTTPFNPQIQGGAPGQVLPISVEEVSSFIKLARDKEYLGLKLEDSLVEVLKELTLKIHPLSLGSVYRATEQIKMLARKLLSFHMDGAENQKNVHSIVDNLTRALYSHDYIINRREAKNELKLKVKELEGIDKKLEEYSYKLFELYRTDMELYETFYADIFLGNDNQKEKEFHRAYIESGAKTDLFLTKKLYCRKKDDQGKALKSNNGDNIDQFLKKEEWIVI